MPAPIKMNELTRQIQNWLIEIEQEDASKFLDNCFIDTFYVDTLLGFSDDRITNMYDVAVYVPPKVYKKISDYANLIDTVEEAIRDNANGDNVYVRNINWKPLTKSAEEFRREQNGIEILKLLNDEDYVKTKIKIMNDSIENTPHLAIGTAKELIETCCKAILDKNKIEINRNWDLLRLVKETNKVMKFPNNEEAENEINQSIKMITSGLSNIVHGITELRNNFGSGHGHKPEFKEIDMIYSKLAVSVSADFVMFYLNILKNDENGSR